MEQLLAAWGAREMEPDRLFYGEPHANDCKQMQQEHIVLERSVRLILDPAGMTRVTGVADDHLQGRSPWMIICKRKRPVPPGDHLQEAGSSE